MHELRRAIILRCCPWWIIRASVFNLVALEVWAQSLSSSKTPKWIIGVFAIYASLEDLAVGARVVVYETRRLDVLPATGVTPNGKLMDGPWEARSNGRPASRG